MQNNAVSSACQLVGRSRRRKFRREAPVNMIGNRGQPSLRPRRTQYHHADRQPVGAKACRHSESSEVAQVDEIGEGAQSAFGPNGSAATSASVGQYGTVGSSSASHCANSSSASRRTLYWA